MIFILTGPVHSGKTTLLRKLTCELKKQKFKIDGFLSEVVLKNQETLGYDLFDLKEEKSIPLLSSTGKKEWERIGSFYFIPQSLEKAKKVILRGKDADILIVDEVGPLELSGRGFWPALKQVIYQPLTRYLLVVRINILEDFLGMLGKSDVKVFDIKNKEIFPQIIKEIRETICIK